MNASVRISVIIPVLNEEQTIRQAIESVSSADQVIVCDGGSDDQSAFIARTYGATVVAAKQGRGFQLRAGVAAADGDLFLFLHADSHLAGQAIDQMRNLATIGEPTFGCFQQHIEDRRRRFRWLELGNRLRATWLQLPYGDQGMFVDRKTYELVGGFDDVPLMEDVLLSKKLRRLVRPQLLPGPIQISARRWQRRGVLRQTLKNWSILGAFYCGVSPTRLAGWYS